MIKSLSPFYITTPLVSPNTGLTCSDYTLYVYVWDGDKASPPATETYKITKPNPLPSTGSDEINIARLISDFIEYVPQKRNSTGLINGNNNRWVKTDVTYTTTDPNDSTVKQNATIQLMSLGYSYGYEGKNIVGITNNILINTGDYKVNRQGVFVLPILVDETLTKTVTVNSFPDGELNSSIDILGTTLSNELVRYIWVQLSETTTDTYIDVVFNGITTNLLIQDECKYDPIDIFFLNKEGAEQVITFFKEQKTSLSVTSSEYESDRGQPLDGNHQFITYNVQGRSKLNVNSGFVDEEMNDNFTQLILSSRTWAFVNTVFTPLNIKTKTLEYKTQRKERLINYAIDFELSYNEINNI